MMHSCTRGNMSHRPAWPLCLHLSCVCCIGPLLTCPSLCKVQVSPQVSVQVPSSTFAESRVKRHFSPFCILLFFALLFSCRFYRPSQVNLSLQLKVKLVNAFLMCLPVEACERKRKTRLDRENALMVHRAQTIALSTRLNCRTVSCVSSGEEEKITRETYLQLMTNY